MAETFGKFAGLAGLSLFVLYMLFRGVVERMLLESLGPQKTYRLLRAMILSITICALTGMVVWSTSNQAAENASAVVKYVIGDVVIGR